MKHSFTNMQGTQQNRLCKEKQTFDVKTCGILINQAFTVNKYTLQHMYKALHKVGERKLSIESLTFLANPSITYCAHSLITPYPKVHCTRKC